jgi:preprotein translocase SecF subunit
MAFIQGVNLDIQFKGGSIIKYGFTGTIEKESFATEASRLLGIDTDTQETSDLATNSQSMVLTIAGDNGLTAEKQQALFEGLKSKFPSNELSIKETYNVDPFYGREFFEKGMLAIGLAALFIVLYVWLRFKSIHGLSAAMMALVALFHDVLMVFFTFVIFKIPINDAFIAVVLTIIGYSINDTIVIYDRMRENQRIYGNKIALGDLINLSQNQSFTRTLNTSMNTFFSMVIVVIVSIVFGLESIRSFALPMMVGIISGCYSTLFIACPLWVMWNTRGGRNMPVAPKAAAKKAETLNTSASGAIEGASADAAPAKKASTVQKKKKKR